MATGDSYSNMRSLTRDFFSTSQKIRILGDLEIPHGIQFRKHHGTLLSQLGRLVSWRNMLAHGLPISLPEGARVWINRKGLKPVQISEGLVEEMETVYESAFDSLGELQSTDLKEETHTKTPQVTVCGGTTERQS